MVFIRAFIIREIRCREGCRSYLTLTCSSVQDILEGLHRLTQRSPDDFRHVVDSEMK